APCAFDQPHRLAFAPPLMPRRGRAVAHSERRIRAAGDLHGQHHVPERAPYFDRGMSDAPAMLLLERGAPCGYLFKGDRVWAHVAPHVTNPEPSLPPDFNPS